MEKSDLKEENRIGVGLAITVSGNKFMSTLKDNCTVKISNLTYVEIVRIIMGLQMAVCLWYNRAILEKRGVPYAYG